MAGWEIIGEVCGTETIAVSLSIREIARLRRAYNKKARWRKLKGVALVQLPDGAVREAEVHWYEAHGVGKVQMKIKHLLD